MVQALREIINSKYYDEVSLRETLSTFSGPSNDKNFEDVIRFLKNDAINFEKEDQTRTYLLINDEQWEDGNIQIDGYFSIALKNMYFNKSIDKSFLYETFGVTNTNNRVAFLIGQLARNECSEKGTGKMLLEEALSYIANVSDIIGGRIVYLDCDRSLQSYYEKNGFSFLQTKKSNNELIQMYRII